MASGDSVIASYDVVMHHEWDGMIHIMSHILKPAYRDPGAPAAVRMRPERNVFEMEYTLPHTPAHFDPRAEGDVRMRRMRHRASELPMQCIHLLGIMRGGALHLHPVASLQQVKPDMSYLDEALRSAADESAAAAAAAASAAGAPTRVTATFRRTDERALAARRSSYAFLRAYEESAPWQSLTVMGSGTRQAHWLRETMQRHPVALLRSLELPIETLGGATLMAIADYKMVIESQGASLIPPAAAGGSSKDAAAVARARADAVRLAELQLAKAVAYPEHFLALEAFAALKPLRDSKPVTGYMTELTGGAAGRGGGRPGGSSVGGSAGDGGALGNTVKCAPPLQLAAVRRPNVPESARRRGPGVPLRGPVRLADVGTYPLAVQVEQSLRHAPILAPSALIRVIGSTPVALAASARFKAQAHSAGAAAARAAAAAASASASSASAGAGRAAAEPPARRTYGAADHPLLKAIFAMCRLVRGNLVLRSDVLLGPHWTVRVNASRAVAIAHAAVTQRADAATIARARSTAEEAVRALAAFSLPRWAYEKGVLFRDFILAALDRSRIISASAVCAATGMAKREFHKLAGPLCHVLPDQQADLYMLKAPDEPEMLRMFPGEAAAARRWMARRYEEISAKLGDAAIANASASAAAAAAAAATGAGADGASAGAGAGADAFTAAGASLFTPDVPPPSEYARCPGLPADKLRRWKLEPTAIPPPECMGPFCAGWEDAMRRSLAGLAGSSRLGLWQGLALPPIEAGAGGAALSAAVAGSASDALRPGYDEALDYDEDGVADWATNDPNFGDDAAQVALDARLLPAVYEDDADVKAWARSPEGAAAVGAEVAPGATAPSATAAGLAAAAVAGGTGSSSSGSAASAAAAGGAGAGASSIGRELKLARPGVRGEAADFGTRMSETLRRAATQAVKQTLSNRHIVSLQSAAWELWRGSRSKLLAPLLEQAKADASAGAAAAAMDPPDQLIDTPTAAQLAATPRPFLLAAEAILASLALLVPGQVQVYVAADYDSSLETQRVVLLQQLAAAGPAGMRKKQLLDAITKESGKPLNDSAYTRLATSYATFAVNVWRLKSGDISASAGV